MNLKKLQHIFFAILLVLSVSSSLYLNLHVQPHNNSLAELTDKTTETAEKLMADIDVFQHIFKSVVKNIPFN